MIYTVSLRKTFEKCSQDINLLKDTTTEQTVIYIHTYLYEHIRTHTTPISTFKIQH